MIDLMIDLETLGTKRNAVVLSIGAVFFDPQSGKLGETFYETLNVEDQLTACRKIDGSTLKWWIQQSSEAKLAAFNEETSTDLVLERFHAWIKAHGGENVCPWGNGSMFDVAIMEDLFFDFGLDAPWKFINVMDLRTFRRFKGKSQKVINLGVKHNALDDAIAQANYVIKFVGGNNE